MIVTRGSLSDVLIFLSSTPAGTINLNVGDMQKYIEGTGRYSESYKGVTEIPISFQIKVAEKAAIYKYFLNLLNYHEEVVRYILFSVFFVFHFYDIQLV